MWIKTKINALFLNIYQVRSSQRRRSSIIDNKIYLVCVHSTFSHLPFVLLAGSIGFDGLLRMSHSRD